MHKKPREQCACVKSMTVIGVLSALSAPQPLDEPKSPWKQGEGRQMHCSKGVLQPIERERKLSQG
eukprot:10694896-Ditylum_brightwellii.AAC.1